MLKDNAHTKQETGISSFTLVCLLFGKSSEIIVFPVFIWKILYQNLHRNVVK